MLPQKWLGNALTTAFVCAALLTGFTSLADAACQLNSPSGKLQHVVYIEFDNVHYTRDNPNVPSDVEQMPDLLNFIKQNGTLDAGDHTVLISHTANDILTTETGLYSDDHGIFVANEFGVFGPGSGLASILFPSSFFYWTDKVSDITPATNDGTYALTTPSGDNVPAPWVPFTRADATSAHSQLRISCSSARRSTYKRSSAQTALKLAKTPISRTRISSAKRSTVRPAVLYAIPPMEQKSTSCRPNQAGIAASRLYSARSISTKPSGHRLKTWTATS